MRRLRVRATGSQLTHNRPPRFSYGAVATPICAAPEPEFRFCPGCQCRQSFVAGRPSHGFEASRCSKVRRSMNVARYPAEARSLRRARAARFRQPSQQKRASARRKSGIGRVHHTQIQPLRRMLRRTESARAFRLRRFVLKSVQ